MNFKSINSSQNVYMDDVFIGHFLRIDNVFQWHPFFRPTGEWQESTLRQIADKLQELNSPKRSRIYGEDLDD